MLLICLSKSKAQVLKSSFVLFISKKTVFAYENLQPEHVMATLVQPLQ